MGHFLARMLDNEKISLQNVQMSFHINVKMSIEKCTKCRNVSSKITVANNKPKIFKYHGLKKNCFN